MTFKSGPPSDRGNYRPLSMLSIPSKLLEGVVCSEIDDQVEEVPNPNQWAYKKGLSTESLLVYLTETWKSAMDNGKYVGILLIDFRKAFDTVDHQILPFKLQSVGIYGNISKWIEDYLTERKQFCEINGVTSKLLPVSCGVPQGSLTGPRLFSIYVGDLPNCLSVGQIHMYADDTTAFCIGNSIEEVTTKMSKMLIEINTWCIQHKLTLHSGKTKALILNRHKFIGPLKELGIGQNSIEYVDEAECLGIKFDQKLCWAPQISWVTKSYNAKIKKLKSMRYLKRQILEDLYYKTIIPATTYCISIWGTCGEQLFNQLEKTHIRAARIIHGIKGKYNNEEILRIANWDPLSYIYKRRLLTIMQQVNLEKVIPTIGQLFSKKEGQRYELRRKTAFKIPSFRTDIGRNTVAFRGPIIWNSLPEDLKLKTVENFKVHLKKQRTHINNFNFIKGTGHLSFKDRNFVYQ